MAQQAAAGGATAGLRVLITNIEMWPPSGTVLYVRDLALELQRQGHKPIVFSTTQGSVVAELRAAGITVTDRLGSLREAPDVVHGHHYAPTMVALGHWPAVPAIYICHGHASWKDATPIHPRIRRYFGVSRICVRRLVREGVAADEAELLLNFIDTDRFAPRGTLSAPPRRALLFSNYAHAGTHLPAVREACRRAGLELDVVGEGIHRIETNPERLLPDYDIVFAKAKAAMEAMAVGTAVILCDFSGVGPMVTSSSFHALRPLNFGFEALREPLQPEPLLREIARYDPADASRVRDLLRSEAGLVAAVEDLIAIYRDVIDRHRVEPSRSTFGLTPRAVRARLFLRLQWLWASLAPDRRRQLTTLRLSKMLYAAARWLFRRHADRQRQAQPLPWDK
ncbi:MAG: hypothetical protein QOI37_1784 [Chloroflexota bacterium]|jgi:hypothetical protein|nr:hypothetical protein [Chloroflexota bacterium]